MSKGSSKKSLKNVAISSIASISTKKLVPIVTAKNEGQKNLFRAMASAENDIIFVDGIAGTGKSFCAISWGLLEFMKGRFEKIIITRPVVEAGENLGFLPGTFEEKILPYITPVMDIIGEHLNIQDIKGMIADGKIVTTPLAFMRGMTFKKAFVLLDEAQNTTPKQMELFLTRIGEGSKMVITGDTRQSDLGQYNGFQDALNILADMKQQGHGLEIVTLCSNSVVRHGIIPEISKRYTAKRESARK